jgi:hypothetical protein
MGETARKRRAALRLEQPVDRLATALTACIATELVLSRIYRGSFANPSSAYISGISLSLLTKPQAGILSPFSPGRIG